VVRDIIPPVAPAEASKLLLEPAVTAMLPPLPSLLTPPKKISLAASAVEEPTEMVTFPADPDWDGPDWTTRLPEDPAEVSPVIRVTAPLEPLNDPPDCTKTGPLSPATLNPLITFRDPLGPKAEEPVDNDASPLATAAAAVLRLKVPLRPCRLLPETSAIVPPEEPAVVPLLAPPNTRTFPPWEVLLKPPLMESCPAALPVDGPTPTKTLPAELSKEGPDRKTSSPLLPAPTPLCTMILPVGPLEEDPDSSSTLPLEVKPAAPVCIWRSPEPLAATPEDRVTLPLARLDDVTALEDRLSIPLLLERPPPLNIATYPPEDSSPPLELEPAITIMFPPFLELLEPPVIDT